MNQFISFIKKEFLHILRDKRTLFILLAMPVILIILFGYAITTEVKKVPLAIVDNSRNDISMQIINRLAASDYFDLYKQANDHNEVRTLFRQGLIQVAVVIPPQYGQNADDQLQILADGTDPNQATQLTSYATAIISTALMTENLNLTQASTHTKAHLSPVVHLLYNPQMKGAYNFVPGVMGLILMLICALMTSVGIVREKELGTMEILLVSPLKPIYIILAKAAPYLILSMVNIATILLLSYFLLGVPIKGSLTLLVGISILYSIVSLCLGLLISTVTDSQQAAMLISAVVLMLPVILLSGMIFPIENMPVLLQWFSNIVPARWYINAIRDIMIKGVTIDIVWKEMAILAGMAIFIVVLSMKRFKIRLE